MNQARHAAPAWQEARGRFRVVVVVQGDDFDQHVIKSPVIESHGRAEQELQWLSEARKQSAEDVRCSWLTVLGGAIKAVYIEEATGTSD
jgi:hypothetical protein